MKAVAITEFGDPDVLALREMPEPQIQAANEVKIQLRAASVNPIDTKLRQRGTFFPDRHSPFSAVMAQGWSWLWVQRCSGFA